MDKNILQGLVDDRKNTREIASMLGMSQTNIRYWLRKFGLKTVLVDNRKDKPPKCCSCGTTDPNRFYGHKKRTCGRCHNHDVYLKGKEKRTRAVEYLGGCCSVCGYNKYECSLDIHHIDRQNKDPNFASMRGWSWGRIRKELEHCILLCRNCHHALHCGHKIETERSAIG